MRNPLLLFPLGILAVIGLALISVNFGIMTVSELIEKLKAFLFLLIPLGLFASVFAFSHFRKRKRGEE